MCHLELTPESYKWKKLYEIKLTFSTKKNINLNVHNQWVKKNKQYL